MRGRSVDLDHELVISLSVETLGSFPVGKLMSLLLPCMPLAVTEWQYQTMKKIYVLCFSKKRVCTDLSVVLRESHVCFVEVGKWGHGQDYIKILTGVMLILVKQKSMEFSQEVPKYYRALCTVLFERQMWIDALSCLFIEWKIQKSTAREGREVEIFPPWWHTSIQC